MTIPRGWQAMHGATTCHLEDKAIQEHVAQTIDAASAAYVALAQTLPPEHRHLLAEFVQAFQTAEAYSPDPILWQAAFGLWWDGTSWQQAPERLPLVVSHRDGSPCWWMSYPRGHVEPDELEEALV